MSTNLFAGLGATLFGGGLANAISGSTSESGGASETNSYGGSQNSAQSISGSQGESQGTSFSNTAGLEASANSAQEAQRAHERQLELLRQAQEYNSREAEKQRNWQADMANTVYTRSVKNMIEAGINPILAANLGLSAGNVNSGASASVSTPSSFMGQTFAEQNSASQQSSYNSSFGKSSEQGSSWNSSNSHSGQWSNSRSGLAEGLLQMAEIGEAGYNAIQSSEALNWALRNFGDGRNYAEGITKDIVEEGVVDFWNRIRGFNPKFYESINPDFGEGYGKNK